MRSCATSLQSWPVGSWKPTAWTPYFMVSDVDATAAKVKELGGRVYMGPQDLPKIGRFAVVADPQGAMFDIFKRI